MIRLLLPALLSLGMLLQAATPVATPETGTRPDEANGVPMLHADIGRSGRVPNAGVSLEKPPTEAWRVTGHASLTAPILVEGTIYVAGADKTVRAVDAGSASERWRVLVPGGVTTSLTLHEERLYVVTGAGNVMALLAEDGARVWSIAVRSDGKAPLVLESALITTADRSILALDLEDGSTLWKRPLSSGVVTLLSSDGERVYFSDDGGHIRALDISSGEQVWSVLNTGTPEEALIVDDGTVLFSDSAGMLVRLDAATGETILESRIGRSATSMPAFVEPGLIVTGVDGQVVAHDVETLAPVWSVALSSSVAMRPIGVGESVLVITGTGDLLALDAAGGRRLWVVPLRDGVVEQPIVLGDSLYAVVARGGLVRM